MLLFKLPWLCHGVRLNLNSKDSGKFGSQNDEESQRSSMHSGSSFETEINRQLRAANQRHIVKLNETTL
jgi:hypothetical protein